MKIILLVFAILAFLAGFGILSSAKSSIHEIEAFTLYIVSSVFFIGFAIVGAINILTERLGKALNLPEENSSPLNEWLKGANNTSYQEFLEKNNRKP